MSTNAFSTWFSQGLPQGFVKKKILDEFFELYALGVTHDESGCTAQAGQEVPLIEEKLFNSSLSRKKAESWSGNDVLSAIGLQLVSLGVSTRHQIDYLYYRNRFGGRVYWRHSLISLLGEANLGHLLVQHPGFDLTALLGRIKGAIDAGSFHACWTEGLLEDNTDCTSVDQGGVSMQLPSYIASVMFAHYVNGAMPPDLSEHYTAERIVAIASFAPGNEWRLACDGMPDPDNEYDFSLNYLFRKMISHAIPLAKHAGVSIDLILERMDQLAKYLQKDTKVDGDLFEAGSRLVRMHVLWDMPELWERHGISVGDLLGAPYTAYHESGCNSWDHPALREAMVSKNHTGSTLGDRMIEALSKRYPDIFDPRLIARRWGSCTAKWFKGVKDFEPARDIINDMMAKQVWHYALANNRLSGFFNEEASLSALQMYLDKGGNASLKRAEEAIAAFPGIVDMIVHTVTKGSQVKRLTALTPLTQEQLQVLSPKLRDAFFETTLGL